MRIAIPTVDGQFARHFGHCAAFLLFDVDPDARAILGTTTVEPPAHQPGLLPRWLRGQGVDVVIAGGMGRRAQAFFSELGMQVVTGALGTAPQELAQAYLEGTLRTGENLCDH